MINGFSTTSESEEDASIGPAQHDAQVVELVPSNDQMITWRLEQFPQLDIVPTTNEIKVTLGPARYISRVT